MDIDILIQSFYIINVMYILDELSGCDILIGRNVTELSDLMHSLIGELLTFVVHRKVPAYSM